MFLLFAPTDLWASKLSFETKKLEQSNLGNAMLLNLMKTHFANQLNRSKEFLLHFVEMQYWECPPTTTMQVANYFLYTIRFTLYIIRGSI